VIPFIIGMLFFYGVIKKMLKDPKFRFLVYLTISTLSIGTIFYHTAEGWSWLDSLFFSVVTLTTVGYGNLVPNTNWGKMFTIIYIFLGLGILAGFIAPIGEYIVERRIEKLEKEN